MAATNFCVSFARDPSLYNGLMEREFDVELYPGEDGWWVIECPSIPGCISQGKTQEEALESIKDAIKGCLEVRRELGLPETVIRRKVTVAA